MVAEFYLSMVHIDFKFFCIITTWILCIPIISLSPPGQQWYCSWYPWHPSHPGHQNAEKLVPQLTGGLWCLPLSIYMSWTLWYVLKKAVNVHVSYEMKKRMKNILSLWIRSIEIDSSYSRVLPIVTLYTCSIYRFVWFVL